MADRKEDIIGCDTFVKMPLSAQALYFHLLMRADENDFVSKYKSIIKLVGCSTDDLNILISKCFAVSFDFGIIIIKSAKMHNFMIECQAKGLNNIEVKKETDQVKNEPDNEVKNEETLDITELPTAENFIIIYNKYPKKGGKQRGFEIYKAWHKGRKYLDKTLKLTNKQMYAAVKRYIKIQEDKGINLQYYKNFDTLMNQLGEYVIERNGSSGKYSG